MRALIPAAGHGTRFAPFTKLVPKELLPIGARPAIALIVEEAVEAGADEVIIVTSPEKPLLKRWFEIEPPKAKITWVDQTEQHGLGHAVLQGAEEVKGKVEKRGGISPERSEPRKRSLEGCGQRNDNLSSDDKVLILLGDALVSGGNASAEMVALSRANNGASVIGCEHVPPEKVSRYGILKLEEGRVVDLVEKPALEDAPSDLAIAGRYLLSTDVFDFLATQTPGKGGEIQLTDAIRRMISAPLSTSQPLNLLPYVYPGKRLDIGNPDGYFAALQEFRKNK